MSRPIHYCVNHPDVVATHACNQCKKRVCYNCRIEAFDHIFCSRQCVAVFFAKEMVKGGFSLLRVIVKAVLWPFFQLARSSRRGWIEVVLVLGLLVSFYFIRRTVHELNSVKLLLGKGETVESLMDTVAILPPKIFEPSESGMVSSNVLDIAGEAESNQIISLSIDGKLERVILPQEGKFIFEKIRLHRGDNRLEIRAISEAGKVSTLQTLLMSYASPTLAYLARDFRRGSFDRKEVALTFDGGSVANAADEILDVLKEYNVKSTFFLTGEFIRRYPKTVRRIVAEGHEVGNHTWSHPHLTSFEQDRRQITRPEITEEKIKEEISKTASLFQLVTGHEMVNLWRAPYGEYNPEILQWAAKAGYKHVGWTVGRGGEENMDTMDWVSDKESQAYRSADEIVAKILNHDKGKKYGSNGAIVLMHLGTTRKDDFPHKKLPEIIQGLREKGYTLIRASEMIKKSMDEK